MEKKDIKYDYYFRGMLVAKLVAKNGIKLSGELQKPFDVLIAGLPNHMSLEKDPLGKQGDEPFGITTIGELKNFLYGKDVYKVKS